MYVAYVAYTVCMTGNVRNKPSTCRDLSMEADLDLMAVCKRMKTSVDVPI